MDEQHDRYRACLTRGCDREADVVLIVTVGPTTSRRERAYCRPCADERHRMFPDRIVDEVTL